MNLRRVGRLYLSELPKVWRTKFPYLGLAASALMAFIAKQSVLAGGRESEITAASYFKDSALTASTFIIWIFSSIFMAMLVAGDAGRGTFRTILTRPVTRGEFLTAKLLTGTSYLFLLFVANIIPSLIIAQGYPLARASEQGVEIPSAMAQVGIFAVAFALTFLPHLATLCFAFCVSTLSSNAATAVGVALGTLLTLMPLKHKLPWDVEPWVVSSYYDTAIGIADEKTSGLYAEWNQENKTYYLVGVSGVTAALFLGVAYGVFSRRDLTSG